MTRVTERIEIDAAPDDVWAVVSDPSTHKAWRPSVVEFRPLSEGPLQVGSRLREVFRFRGKEIEVADEITALDPPRRFGVRGEWKAASFDAVLALEPASGGTEVTFDWTFEPKSLLTRVAAPFLKGTLKSSTREELEGLKAYVEGQAVAPSAA